MPRLIKDHKLLKVLLDKEFVVIVSQPLLWACDQSKGLRRCRPRRKLWSHSSCSRECKRVWGNEPSHSQMNSHFGNWSPKWTLKFSEGDFRGQNSLDWNVLYIIKNSLEHRCLKWAGMTHLNIWNTSCGQKKRRESNWQFDFRPLKVKNHLDFLGCKWCGTYHWKAFDEGYNFVLDFISIGGLHTKLWAPKVTKVPVARISRLPLGNPRTKWHLGAGPMARHKIYYKGEGGGFPQVWAVVSLVSLSLFMARPSTKGAQIMH